MKKITLLISFVFGFLISCDDESIENLNINNSEFLLSKISCETCTNHLWEFNYDNNNLITNMTFTNNFVSNYMFTYDNNRLEEVIQEPARFFAGTFIDGYVITSFSYITDNEFIGYFQFFNLNDDLVKYHRVKYVFEGDTLKALTEYIDDITNPTRHTEYVHDLEGRLLYYDINYNNGLSRYEILAWEDNPETYTVGMFTVPNYNNLQFFPNKIISTKLPLEIKSENPNNSLNTPTFFDIEYNYDDNQNASASNLIIDNNVFSAGTFEYIEAN